MRSKEVTMTFYVDKLGFAPSDNHEMFNDYLMMSKDDIEIHFFLFEDLIPRENDGQVYIRCQNINELYNDAFLKGIVHPNDHLNQKPWGQWEFSILDPDTNLLTFGQEVGE
jgi:hypothetical protein